MRETTPREDLLRGIWKENPVLVQLLGLCPALAVTNTVPNSIAMGLATFFVLLGSSFLVSLMKNWIPAEVRISAYILIIATFVTIADFVLAAVVPVIHKELGAFIALIVVNCMILGRQEAFASKRPVGRALLDAVLGTGAGFMIALLMMGTFREILGKRLGDGLQPVRRELRAVDRDDPAAGRLPHARLHPPGLRVVEGTAGPGTIRVRQWPHGVASGEEAL